MCVCVRACVRVCVWFYKLYIYRTCQSRKASSRHFVASEAQGPPQTQLWRAIKFCLIGKSACWLPLYRVQIVHYSWHLLRALFKITSQQHGSYIGSVTVICLACDRIAFLSGIFYSQEKYAKCKNVSECIFEHWERSRNELQNKKKNGFHRTRTPLPQNMQPNMIDSSPRYPLHYSYWLENASRI